MADTSFASDNALTIKKWSALLFKQVLGDIFFGKFVGKSDKDIIQTKTDLLKDRGDKVVFGLRMKLSGAGKKDDESLEGEEEALTFHDFSATLHLRQNAVRAAGKMTLRRTAFDIKSEAKDGLADWLTDKLDEDTLLALSGLANSDLGLSAVAPSTNRKWYGGQTVGSSGTEAVLEAVANDAAIDSATTKLFGPMVVSAIKRKAKLATPKIRPVRVDGKDYYVMFIHPYQMKALRNTYEWKQSQYHAALRGLTNPIFAGAECIIDGVIIHEYDKIETRLGAGGSTPSEYFESGDNCANGMYVARALFCGAQAGVHAYGQYPGWYEKMFQYGRIPGVATDVILACAKTVFNSEDFGSIIVDTAYVTD